MKPNLRIVEEDQAPRRIKPSAAFIRRTRNPALTSPERFEPTVKREGDIVL